MNPSKPTLSHRESSDAVIIVVVVVVVVGVVVGVTRWRSWLRHRATSRKVAGSISDGVIGIFIVILPAALWP